MPFDVVNIGAVANDGTGDSLRAGGTKINANFAKAVEGPASATSAAVAAFDGTDGKLLQNGNALAVTAGKFVPTANTVAGNGMYLPAADEVAISSGGTQRLRIAAASFISQPVISNSTTTGSVTTAHTRAVIASEDATASGSRSAVVASLDSTASGSRSAVVASEDSTANGNRSAVVASFESTASAIRSVVVASEISTASESGTAVIASIRSESSAARSLVVASRRTLNNVGDSLALGFATTGDNPLIANRKIHLFGSNGNVYANGELRFGGLTWSTDTPTGGWAFDNDSGALRVRDGTTERVRITSAGAIQLPSGSPGIKFGTRNANLTDYEEGTWSTTFSDLTNLTGTGTLSGTRYTKIGRIAHISALITGLSITATNTLTSLVFTAPAMASNEERFCGVARNSAGNGAGAIVQYTGDNNTQMFLIFHPSVITSTGAATFSISVTYVQ